MTIIVIIGWLNTKSIREEPVRSDLIDVQTCLECCCIHIENAALLAP